MLNYNDFIGHKIINKNGELGEVVSFNIDHLVIAYQTGKKTYNPEVAVRNGFLSFVDEDLKHQYDEELVNKDIVKKQKEEIARKIDADRPIKIQRVNKINDQYERKIRVLQSLFGKDFIYPPYVKFLRKYKDLIKAKDSLFRCVYLFHPYAYKYN